MLVSEVRRACAAVGADVIATQRPGYMLRAAAARIDLACFQSQMASAREAASAGRPIWEANALSAVGWIRLQLGEHAEARAACEAALTLFRRHHDRGGEAATLDSLGALAYRQGDHERALEYYGQCLELRRGTGNTFQAADTLVGMGDAHHALGNPAEARAAWRKALALYRAQHRRAEIRRVTEKLEAADAVPGAPASRAGGP